MKVKVNGVEYEAEKWDGRFTEKVKQFSKSSSLCPFCRKAESEHGHTAAGDVVCPWDFMVDTEEGVVIVDPTFLEAEG